MSDLQDQLKSLFPDYQPTESPEEDTSDGVQQPIWLQSDPLICKYEKRKGKPITIIEGYDGADADFKASLSKSNKSCVWAVVLKTERLLFKEITAIKSCKYYKN